MISDLLAGMIRRKALDEAKRLGCTCDPEVSIVEVRPHKWTSLTKHDDDCVLTRRTKAGTN